MPYPNEHSCRLENPDKYDKFRRKNCAEKHDDKCIDHIYGIKENKSEIQALRYDKEVWTEASARSHCKSKDGTFEAASKEDKTATEDKSYRCECIECGHQMDSDEHCKDIKCPECGGEMRRSERPGPGQKAEGNQTKQKEGGMSNKSWFEIKNKADSDKAEIWIYEEIGENPWGFGDSIGAKQFQKDLSAIKASQIDLHINSPGGNVFDGNTIYNLLKQHPAKVTTYIDGLAASIASVIALAGDHIIMAENGMFMIHKPLAMTIGDEDVHEETAQALRKIKGTIVRVYKSRTGKSDEEIEGLLKPPSWLDSDQALELGFVDEISGTADMAACAKFVPFMAKAGIKNIPEILNPKQIPSAKDTERALRDVGYSVKQAKTILAKGLSDDLRDVDQLEDPDQVTESLRDVEVEKPKTRNWKTERALADANHAMLLAKSKEVKNNE
jgi:ATP-dependent protease ClpP protease subunit/predicted RNA-binding Zn-ribbon protein involved in translation (DUF1610 family)